MSLETLKGANMESILNSTKKLLGITEDYDYFDQDIIININSVFMILNQMGVGPKEAFTISDDTSTWNDFIGTSSNIESVKTYMYLKVRLMFDPPASGTITEVIKATISELEWRLNVESDK